MPRGYPNDPNRTWSRQPKKKGAKRTASPVARKAAPVAKRKAAPVKRVAKRPAVRRNTMHQVSQANMEAAILSTLQSVCNQLLRLEGAIYARPYISQPILQTAGSLEATLAKRNAERELADKMAAINNGSNLTEQGCCGGKAVPGTLRERVTGIKGAELEGPCGLDLISAREQEAMAKESISPKRKTTRVANPNIKVVPEVKAPVEEKNGLDELTDEDMMV